MEPMDPEFIKKMLKGDVKFGKIDPENLLNLLGGGKGGGKGGGSLTGTDFETLLAKVKLMGPPITDLQIGDVLVWRPGCKNRKFPGYEAKLIVTRLISEQERIAVTAANVAQAGTGMPAEYWDIMCAVAYMKDRDGDVLEYYHDSRRLKRWTPN